MSNDTPRTDDLAALVARMARHLRKQNPDDILADQAVRYLQAHSLLNPLRDGDEPDEDIQELFAQVESLTVTNIQQQRDLTALRAKLAEAERDGATTRETLTYVELRAAELATKLGQAEQRAEAAEKAKAFCDWLDLYGVGINTVADERGSYRLDWHRGNVFGNTLAELMDKVDTTIDAARSAT